MRRSTATQPGQYDTIHITAHDVFGSYTFTGPSVTVADPPSAQGRDTGTELGLVYYGSDLFQAHPLLSVQSVRSVVRYPRTALTLALSQGGMGTGRLAYPAARPN
jgi:hypothetical protein